MNFEKPDYRDAELVLKLYDMRREEVMRHSRNAVNREFLPRSIEDLLAITKFDHPLNAAFRQLTTYWEMAYSFARHGIVNADFLAENAGEGLLLFAKVKPFLQEFRKAYSPTAFLNAEWLVEHSAVAAQRLEWLEGRVALMMKARS